MNDTSKVDYRSNNPKSTPELLDWHAGVPVATAIEPGLPIVDAHHHVYASYADKFFYPLEDFQRDMNSGHRIIGSVYIEAYESGWRTSGPEALRPVGEVELAAGIGSKPVPTATGDSAVAAAIVSHADLTLGDAVEEVLQAQLAVAQGRLRGVRHRLAAVEGPVEQFHPVRRELHVMRDASFRRGVARLARLGLSFDAWVYHTQLDELIELADAFPDTRIVVDHVGGPIGVANFRPRRAEVLREWEANLRALAMRPNVVMKIGGMGMAVLGFGFENGERPPQAQAIVNAWKPLIDVCVDVFGTSRCMFESNFPVDKQSCSYVELWNAFKLATQGWSQQERGDLFYRTACRAYSLPELERQGDQLLAASLK